MIAMVKDVDVRLRREVAESLRRRGECGIDLKRYEGRGEEQ